MTDERELGILDYIILDHIRQYKAFDDYAMARRLHCSRLFLLERLERLLSEGYVTQEGDAFDLTPYGASAWVPLDLYHEAAQATEPDVFPLTQYEASAQALSDPHREAAQTTEDAQTEFSWTELYIPRPGWSDQ